MAMTDLEKENALSVLILPDTAATDLLNLLVKQAESIVLNKRYPFGIPENATVPAQYEHIQIRIAVELYSKMGAEGQTAHAENGVSRTYASASVSEELLREITPKGGVV